MVVKDLYLLRYSTNHATRNTNDREASCQREIEFAVTTGCDVAATDE